MVICTISLAAVTPHERFLLLVNKSLYFKHARWS